MTGLLPPRYLFSQHSLNTYLRCRRRFLLKYVDQQPWPMSEEEDPLSYQKHLAQGRTLHQWLEREHLGLDMGPIVAASDDRELRDWWEATRQFDLGSLPTGLREAELPLVVPLGDYRLYARYDYLALDPGGEAVIVDWKTLTFVPSQRVLRERVQTRVYLYALVAAGAVLTGGTPISPELARMVYWFTNYPDDPATVPYSERAFREDQAELVRLVAEIAGQPREAFTCAEDDRACACCNYRTLCRGERGTPAGAGLDWLDEDIDFELELEQVSELEY
jgi:hypothetical protein